MESEALQPLLEAMKESAEKQLQQPQSNAHATLRALLVKALNDPTIFCGFAEIKQILQPALVSSSSSSSNATTSSNMLATLDLFSYGVYHDYQNAAPGTYLALTESQIFKLRQLTLLTLVEQQATAPAVSLGDQKSNTVSYQTLAQHLGFDQPANIDPAAAPPQQAALSPAFRQVEEVIIACLYAGILSGRLCQKTQSLIVGGSTGTGGTLIQSRDVPVANVPLLWQQYNELFQTLQQCSHQLELQASRVQKVRNDQEEYWIAVDERKKATVPTSGSASAASSLLRGGGSGGSSSSFFRALTSSPFSTFTAPDDDGLIANPSEPSMARNPSAAASRRQPKRSRGGFGSSAQ